MATVITMVAGDTRVLDLTITRSGSAEDLAGSQLRFLAQGPVTTISKSTDDGGIVMNTTDGTAQIAILPEDTDAIVLQEKLTFEIQLRTASGVIETINHRGTLKVLPQQITETP